MLVKLTPAKYKYPASLPMEYYPKVKPTVEIDTAEIEIAAKKGVSWIQLADYYCVDEETLKDNFYIVYIKARAMLEINVLDAMVTSALEGNPQMLKWLSLNWLSMSEHTQPIIIQDATELSPLALDEKIANLTTKLNKNSV